jgi:cytochrome c peroxidase
VPGFIAAKDALAEKGIDEIICVSVNDAFVMQHWGEATGATAAGLTLLSDAGDFARAMGMQFDAAAVGMMGRSKRYALMAEDGVVKVWHPETGSGCEVSGGPAMLAAV